MCTSCRVINNRQPLLFNDLENEKNFKKLLVSVEKRGELIKRLINNLTSCKEFIINLTNISNIESIEKFFEEKFNEIKNDYPEDTNIEKRFRLSTDIKLNKDKIINFVQKQIDFLENLSEEWKKYISCLEKMKAEIAVPILYGSTIIGVLAIQSYEKGCFTESDKLIIQTLANRVAGSIMEHQQDILKGLLEIGNTMTTCWEYDKVGEMLSTGAIKGMARLKNNTGVYPLLYVCGEPKLPDNLIGKNFGNNFSFKARTEATDEEKKFGGTPVSNTGLGYEAIKKFSEHKQKEEYVFIVRENVDDPISGGSEAARNWGIQTTACLPLTYNRLVYGLFYIHVKPRYFFTELEKNALVLFAKQAAIVLKNAPILGQGLPYSKIFGTKLIDKASETEGKYIPDKIEESSLNLFEKFSNILNNEKDKLKDVPQLQAVEIVQIIVSRLVNASGLPENIAKRYIEFGKDESLLYFSDSYRDHFFHPFHTFLLGFVLLRKLQKTKEEKSKAKELKHVILPLCCDDLSLRKWLLISLWHDICYTAEKGPAWLTGYIKEKLGFDIKVDQEWGSIFTKVENIDALKKIARKFATADEQKETVFYAWLSNQLEKHKDHGVLSAILLIRDFAEYDCLGITEDELIECALCIAMHNFPKAISGDKKEIEKGRLKRAESNVTTIGALNIDNYQLAFLLSYCDTSQEWGRPSKRRESHDIRFEDIDMLADQKEIRIKLGFDIKEYMEIQKKYKDEEDAWGSLYSEWKEKTKALSESWICNNSWKFYIHQISINMKNGTTRDLSVYKNPNE